jgi:hypothetical protein
MIRLPASSLSTALAVALSCLLYAPLPAHANDDAVGELMGDLMFHADLLSALDTTCPAQAAGRDWRAVIKRLPADVRNVELRTISKRLSADAAQAMVRGSGGCSTRHFARAYAETRIEYESLLEQWAQLSI